MTDKNLRIGIQFDPKGIAEARKHIQQLSKEGIGLSKSFAGINFGTQGGNAQFAKQLLANKKALESLGDTGKNVSKVLESTLRKEMERQQQEYDKLGRALDKITDKYEKFRRQRDAATNPAERARAELGMKRMEGHTAGVMARRQSTGEELASLQTKSNMGILGNPMAAASMALVVAQGVAQGMRSVGQVLSQGATVNQAVQAQGTQFTARMAQGALHGDISDMIALTAKTRNITSGGTKLVDPEGVFDTARLAHKGIFENRGARAYTGALGGALNVVSGGSLNEEAANVHYGAEREKADALNSAVQTGRTLKAHEIQAYEMMKGASFGRVAQARRYGGMGGVKSWFGHGFGEGGSMALQAAYSDALGNSRMLESGDARNAALRMAKVGISSGAGAGLLRALTGARGGDISKGADDLENILGRAFKKGLTDPQFLDSFAAMVSNAAYGVTGSRDAKAFAAIVGDVLGKNPDSQRMANVQAGVGEANALLSGQKGGMGFRVMDFSAAERMLREKGVTNARAMSANILAGASFEDLVGSGSESVKTALLEIPENQRGDFLKSIRAEKIRSRGTLYARQIGGSTEAAWNASGGDMGKFIATASKADKARMAEGLRMYTGVGSRGSADEVLNLLAGMVTGGDDKKNFKGAFRGAKDKGGSTELSIATHIESMAREADKLVKGIDVVGLQKQQKEMWEKIAADADKFGGNLGPASVAMKALEDSALALATTFKALAMLTPEGRAWWEEQERAKRKEEERAKVSRSERAREDRERELGLTPGVVPRQNEPKPTFRRLKFPAKTGSQ